MHERVASWGNLARDEVLVLDAAGREREFPRLEPATRVLPFGNGRSYGDSCLNPGGALLRARGLDRFIAFDPKTGVLAAEAGVLLDEILALIVPQGWFLPVSPGTRFVTLGGAVANDVHGKNHHSAGTFGRHVRAFELLRSDGQRRRCAPGENPEWFAATLGGLGLTGLITWVELQLRPIAGPWLEVETLRMANLSEFFALARASAETYEYTVAWLDCSVRGARLGRGIFERARHAVGVGETPPSSKLRRVPVTPPGSLVNRLSVRLFNFWRYHRHGARPRHSHAHYTGFFYPLDGIGAWNRLYGPRGFRQYQCVLPAAAAEAATRELLERIAASGLASFLAVLKTFGDLPSPGMLSFPRSGVTLAVDFPEAGARLEALFQSLDAVVGDAGGRLYPAKDSRMPPSLFRAGYPNWPAFAGFVDPRVSSGFWRRVAGGA
jgi:FAD/FMN-containing dehydrogenase